MTALKLEPVILNHNEMKPFAMENFRFTDDADGALIPMQGDSRMMIVVLNGTSKEQTITLKKGSGPMSATEDKIATVASTDLLFMTVESGLYGQTEGENRGYIHMTFSSGDMQVCCLRLPE